MDGGSIVEQGEKSACHSCGTKAKNAHAGLSLPYAAAPTRMQPHHAHHQGGSYDQSQPGRQRQPGQRCSAAPRFVRPPCPLRRHSGSPVWCPHGRARRRKRRNRMVRTGREGCRDAIVKVVDAYAVNDGFLLACSHRRFLQPRSGAAMKAYSRWSYVLCAMGRCRSRSAARCGKNTRSVRRSKLSIPETKAAAVKDPFPASQAHGVLLADEMAVDQLLANGNRHIRRMRRGAACSGVQNSPATSACRRTQRQKNGPRT